MKQFSGLTRENLKNTIRLLKNICVSCCVSEVVPTIVYDDFFYPILFEDDPTSIHDSDVIAVDVTRLDGESDAVHCSRDIDHFRSRVVPALRAPLHGIRHHHSGVIVISVQVRPGYLHFVVLTADHETDEVSQAQRSCEESVEKL